MARKNDLGFPGCLFLKREVFYYTVKFPGKTKPDTFRLTWKKSGNPITEAYPTDAKKAAKELWEKTMTPNQEPEMLSVPKSIAELAKLYGEFVEKKYTQSPEHKRIKWAVAFLSEYYGHLPIHKLGPLKLIDFQDKLIKQKRHSRTGINTIVRLCRNMFKWAVSRQIVDVTHHASLMTVEGLREGHPSTYETEPVTVVENDVWQAVLPYLPPVVADMVKLQYLTGMRSGELVRMNCFEIERQPGKPCWIYRPEKHKNRHRKHERVVVLGPQAVEIASKYLHASVFFDPAEAEIQRGHKPRPNIKKQYDTGSYRHAIGWGLNALNKARSKKDAKAIKLHFCPHQLRHTTATNVRSEFDLEHAQATMGHKNIDATQIYAEVMRSKAWEVALKMG